MIKRWMPDALAGRIMLLLGMAIVAANIAALAILTLEQQRSSRQADADREIERIAALIPAMEAVAAPARQSIARDASTRFARVRVDLDPMLRSTAPDMRSGLIASRIRETLGRDDVAVAFRPPARWGRTGDKGRNFGRNGVIAVTIPLSPRDGQQAWLNVVTSGAAPPTAGVEQNVFFTVLILSLLSVLGVAMIIARRLTAPLQKLATAATAAGRGDRTARVPEDGPKEMRAAAEAFNAMQAEISHFDAERMRTLAAVGHDLRTPMTSLRIRAEMIDDDDLREPMIRTLEEMTVMADGLVSFAKNGRDAETTSPLDLRALLSHICAERHVAFPQGPAVMIQGRKVGLSRVFGNLIDNAQRYGQDVHVTLKQQDQSAQVTITDRGPGIPDEQLEDMFAPFARGEDSRNLDTGGAGLGLSIARAIVQSHGGHITLANRDNGGLCASVTLPLG